MTRPPNTKEDLANINSSPMKPTIPRLTLNLKLTNNNTKSLSTKEEDKSKLPKITLSVRRPNENRENTDERQVIHEAIEVVDVPKKKRGRPPKNLKVEISDPSTRRQLSHPLTANRTVIWPPHHIPIPNPKPLLPARSNNINLSDTLDKGKGPITAHSTIGDAELSKISRLKGHLSSLIDSDIESINHAEYSRPFLSKQDMIERLLPFHLLSMAQIQVSLPSYQKLSFEDLACEMEKIRTTFQSFVQIEDQGVPTELKLLEQRLCLEEEKFLLEKMRTEYRKRLAENEI